MRVKIKFKQYKHNVTDQLTRGKMKQPVRETRQLGMPKCGAGLVREARLNLAPPFQCLIMRLIYPVTYVTILPYDLLSSRPDGEIGTKRERGKKEIA